MSSTSGSLSTLKASSSVVLRRSSPIACAASTAHPGGIKERKAGHVLDGRFPERVLEKAVERMLPKESPLARAQMTHLRLYNSAEHPHAAQNPEVIDFKSMNAKNARSQ